MILFTFKEVNDHFISRETITVMNHKIFLSLSKGKISNLPARCGFVILHARYIPPIWFHGNTTLTKSIYPCPSYEVLTSFNTNQCVNRFRRVLISTKKSENPLNLCLSPEILSDRRWFYETHELQFDRGRT